MVARVNIAELLRASRTVLWHKGPHALFDHRRKILQSGTRLLGECVDPAPVRDRLISKPRACVGDQSSDERSRAAVAVRCLEIDAGIRCASTSAIDTSPIDYDALPNG